ncbi:MAG: class I adenylate-forming enzyme family protein [Gammaproteobacteria bacterium]
MYPTPLIAGPRPTFADAFEEAAREYGRYEAFVDGTRRLSYAQWHRDADGLAATLAGRGVAPGDVVAILLPTGIDFAICYGAAQLAGAIGTGINTRLGPREIAGILNKCTPRLVIVEDGTVLPDVGRPIDTLPMSALAAAYRGTGLGARRPRRRHEDPAVIIWTSGTTGIPKGAWFDHRGLYANVTVAGVMGAPFDRRLAATPFAHAGFMVKVWEQVAFVIDIVVAPPRCPAADMLRLIVDERVTFASAVPAQWAKFVKLPGLAGLRFPHVRLAMSSTAPTPPELIEELTRILGAPVISRYAMTEVAGVTGSEPDDDPQVKYRTVGRAQIGVKLQIVDGEGREVPPGEVGRVRIHAPTAMRGYWNEPVLTATVLSPDGWITSGDLGRLDPQGNLILAGRVGDMYIRGGYNVYPLEVENVLTEHPAVAAAAVVGVPAPVLGEIGVAFVVPADRGAPPDLETLRAWTRARIADYKAPDRLVIVEELPVNAMQKVDKNALRAAPQAQG